MRPHIKAVVFKTAQLQATKYFFESVLELKVRESSVQHFVVHSKGLRLVFLESAEGFETEIYLDHRTDADGKELKLYHPVEGFVANKDPNGIKILTFHKHKI